MDAQMNPFEEFMFDAKYVLRFYRVDHGLVCTINESMVSELRAVETKIRQQQAEIEALKAENSHLKYEISSGAWNPVPLTDAELSEVYEEVYINYAGKDFPVDLGRAILRKAQEK
jgi:hypothetical protein